MDLLWISDSPDTPSGFGNVTRFVCDGLARRGHTVSILGWQTREARDWCGCKVYPSALNPLGSDALYRLLLRTRPEIVIALGDIWWLPHFAAPHVRRQMELIDAPWALYFPIDGDMEGEHLPPSWLELLREVDVPVAMSRYGQRIVQQCGISCACIPHGVDLDVFRPPADRSAAKRRIQAEEKFLVLSDSRNQPRKMLPRLLDIFAQFAAARSDVRLHLHTDPDDEFTRSPIYSYNLRADLKHLGLEHKVQLTPGLLMERGGGIALEELAKYYQAADVHLLASSGEGFGLPTLQAAAAGAVPLAGAYSASRELVEGHGEAIAIEEWSENEFGIRRGLIDVDDAVAKLVALYDNPQMLGKRSISSRSFAEAYGWEQIIDQWDALLHTVSRRRQRRVARAPQATAPGRVKELLPSLRGLPQGISVQVNMVERVHGVLEASILADARGKSSDVKIPTVPKPSVTARVKVLRRFGYIGMAAEDLPVFQRLQRIFPALSAWLPRSMEDEFAPEDIDGTDVVPVYLEAPEASRFEIAQSILLLNVSGQLDPELLRSAALLGVPCVGSEAASEQLLLWPELSVQNEEEAVIVGRTLLTNAALLHRLANVARARCLELYCPDEEEVATTLRALSEEQKHNSGEGPRRYAYVHADVHHHV
jgi:glycosyltransferase involved in cell wall biosynthesis